VLEAAGDRLLIAAGQGAVAPQGLQPAGKRPMNVAQFLRGYRLEPGDRFTKDEGGRRKAEGGE
jgi:methionyl-tRNA formyltransferase